MSPKLFWGAGILRAILAAGLLGRLFWDLDGALIGANLLRLPPPGFENIRGQTGSRVNPLGTEGSSRDMLALLIVGTPSSLYVGLLADELLKLLNGVEKAKPPKHGFMVFLCQHYPEHMLRDAISRAKADYHGNVRKSVGAIFRYGYNSW